MLRQCTRRPRYDSGPPASTQRCQRLSDASRPGRGRGRGSMTGCAGRSVAECESMVGGGDGL